MSYDFLKKETAPRILVEAVKIMGVKEIAGYQHNPEILRWAKVLGLDKVYKSDEIAWCGLAMAYAAHMADVAVTKDPLWALNWAKWGTAVTEPMLGDILTFKRDGGGHVGLYIGEDDTCYHVLGGNQGNMMKPSRIEKSRLYKARRTSWKVAQPKSVRKIMLDAKGEVSKNEA